jgi:hypothetical protein
LRTNFAERAQIFASSDAKSAKSIFRLRNCGNVGANFMRHLFIYISLLFSLTSTCQIDTVYATINDGWYTIGIHGPSYRNCNGSHCNGLIIDTFQNGQIKECASYINGQIRGPFIEYYESGQIKAIGAYDSSGYNIGKLISYFPNGQIERISTFNNKKRIRFQSFFESGKIEHYQELNCGYMLKYDFDVNEMGDTLSAHILTDSINLIYKCGLK